MGVRYEVIQDIDDAIKLTMAGLTQVSFRLPNEKWITYAGSDATYIGEVFAKTPIKYRRKGHGNGRCWRLNGIYYRFRLVLEE